MNEFIVWYSNDINQDKFSKEFTLQELISQEHLDYICDSRILVNYKVDSINNSIRLKDINGKSIYADSSIVEFTYWFREDLQDKRVDEKRMKGYFHYDNNTLSYLFHNLLDNSNYFYGRMNFKENLKIIDTIQENKLGLIK